MADPESTRWTLIQAAAKGDASARSEFARCYTPLVRSCLLARWRHTPLLPEVDDAVQDVFLDCLRDDGALTRVEDDRPGGFRAFLFGVIRNAARQAERRYRRRARQPDSRLSLDALDAKEEPLSRVFDREWTRTLMRQAADLMEARARGRGTAARRRVELLRLRFADDLPIREIAKRWGESATRLHYHYARAREEFKAALREVVRLHHPESTVEDECARLFDYVQ
jgi:RNA polymerase sigma-70 factor (ECF subfamily)